MIKSLLRLLGLDNSSAKGGETVRRIAAELERLEPEHARYIAAFAFVLSRVASADLEVSAEEAAEMERLVREKGVVSADQAALVVQIARTQHRLFGATDDFLVTRELATSATPEQKLAIVECLYAVAAADKSVQVVESNEIARIAKELKVDPADVSRIRQKYRDHIAARQGL